MKLSTKIATLTVACSFILAACGGNSSTSSAGQGSGQAPKAAAVVTDSPAADLRTKLNTLLGEHLILAAKATGAAIGGRTAEFNAYGALLNKNGTEIGAMVGVAFGADAETKFNGIWSAHNGFFVDYTTGVATKDKAKMDTAVNNLVNTYIPQFSQFLAGATGLPEGTLADLTKTHVLTTKAIVDDQGAGNWVAAYADIRKAYAHMEMIGDPLSEAIAAKLPAKFAGDPKNRGVTLRVSLNQLLQEHLYLASFATDAALGSRNGEFAAAGDALNKNGTDLGGALGGLYGPDAETKFNGIWSAHNGFFVDYTTGVATKDKAKMDAAVGNLVNVYIPQFSQFISGATGLPQSAVADLTKTHVLSTKDVVDAQGGGDVAGASVKDRVAAQHMQEIADPLAKAIVAKLPDKFKN